MSFKVNGLPRPTLRWFKDDEEVKDHARLTVEEGEEGKYRLTLHQVDDDDDDDVVAAAAAADDVVDDDGGGDDDGDVDDDVHRLS